MSGVKRYFSTEHTTVTPTVTAGAYSANDVMGGLMTIELSAQNTGGTLGTIRIRDNDAVGPAGILYLFKTAPTAIADNVAFSLADADSDKLLAVITLGTWVDFTAFKWIAVAGKDDGSSEPIDFRTDTGDIYAYFKVTGTPTMTTTSALSFDFVFWGD